MELRQKYPLKVLLKVLDLSKTTYYYNKKIIDKGDRNADLKAKIKEIYEKNRSIVFSTPSTKSIKQKTQKPLIQSMISVLKYTLFY